MHDTICTQKNTEDLTEIGGPPDRLFALIIGINRYASPDFADLGGAVKDAQAMEQYLKKTLQVADKNIRTIFDDAATRQGIINAFRDLRDDPRIDNGDPIVIFYAGHGGELKAPWPPKSTIECLIPHDCEANGTEPIQGREPIPDRTLGALIEDIAEAKGNNITVIFDCCHSGSGTRDLDEEYVPRRVRGTRNLNIGDTLDAGIWGNRVGDTQSGFMFHGSPRSHVLLAACGETEIAYEYRGRGRFTIALLKALKYYTDRNELTHIKYAHLLERLQLPGRGGIQQPRCEGFNRHRPLFNGRVSTDREVYYSAVSLKGGKYVINAGAAHGVSHGVRFALYDDKRKCELGTVLVDEASEIEDFKTTVTTSIRLTGASFAKMSGVGQLPLYVAPGSHSSVLEFLWPVDGHGTDAQIFRLVDVTEAKLELAVENDLVRFRVLEESVKKLGLTELPWKATNGSLSRVLRGAAHYYWFLDFARERNLIGPAHEVTVNFYRLNIKYDEFGDGEFYPAEPGFCKKDPKLNNADAIDFVVDQKAFYGIKVTNQTRWDLYLNVFMFNNGSFSIVQYHTQSTADKSEPPLKRGEAFTIGYGSETTPLTYSLREGQDLDVGYLKIFFATRPIDLSAIAQPPQFEDVNARDGADGASENKNHKWDVLRNMFKFLSLSPRADSDDACFTLEIPVVQRRVVL